MTQELTSTLPAVDGEALNMRIVDLNVTQTFKSNLLTTRIVRRPSDMSSPGAADEYACASVYLLDPVVTHGYMPSKVWYDGTDFHFVYYMCEGLPPQARPFGDKPAYAFAIEATSGVAIEYDASIRMFIDQIVIPGAPYEVMGFIEQRPARIAHMFIVAEDQARQVFQTKWNYDKWELEDGLGELYA